MKRRLKRSWVCLTRVLDNLLKLVVIFAGMLVICEKVLDIIDRLYS